MSWKPGIWWDGGSGEAIGGGGGSLSGGSLSGGSMPRTAIIADKNTLAKNEREERRRSARYYPSHHSMVHTTHNTCTLLVRETNERVYAFVWSVGGGSCTAFLDLVRVRAYTYIYI